MPKGILVKCVSTEKGYEVLHKFYLITRNTLTKVSTLDKWDFLIKNAKKHIG